MKVISTILEDHEIRRLYDEKTETWFFSVVGIVQILTQQPVMVGGCMHGSS